MTNVQQFSIQSALLYVLRDSVVLQMVSAFQYQETEYSTSSLQWTISQKVQSKRMRRFLNWHTDYQKWIRGYMDVNLDKIMKRNQISLFLIQPIQLPLTLQWLGWTELWSGWWACRVYCINIPDIHHDQSSRLARAAALLGLFILLFLHSLITETLRAIQFNR